MNGLLIGRFQPFHLGHLDAFHYALSKVDKLWVGLGSSNKPPQKNNPFSSEERKKMILESLDESLKKRIEIYFIPDFEDHKKWVEHIATIVPKFDIVFTNDEMTKYLYSKRNTSVFSIPFTTRNVLSGTHIRDLIISDQPWEQLVPEGTKNFLTKTNAKQRLRNL
ncbi:MAG: nicotinamide-nucleotide adenylyltransferase [Nitrosopumilus sp.]|nr:nicotinamide-nucleotide adenylyltransferase [Nitrosopumilus sp.]